jgi:hypothetical protein
MDAVRISETSANFNVTTRRYIPEDSKLHTRRRENLTSHIAVISLNRIKQLAFVIGSCYFLCSTD